MVCFTQGHEHTKPACLPWFILAWKQFRAGTMGGVVHAQLGLNPNQHLWWLLASLTLKSSNHSSQNSSDPYSRLL